MTNHGHQPLLLDSSTFDHNGSGLKQSGHQHTRQDSHRNQQDNARFHGVFLSNVNNGRVRVTTSFRQGDRSLHHEEIYQPQRLTPCGVRRQLCQYTGPASEIEFLSWDYFALSLPSVTSSDSFPQGCVRSENPFRESATRTHRAHAPMW